MVGKGQLCWQLCSLGRHRPPSTCPFSQHSIFNSKHLEHPVKFVFVLVFVLSDISAYIVLIVNCYNKNICLSNMNGIFFVFFLHIIYVIWKSTHVILFVTNKFIHNLTSLLLLNKGLGYCFIKVKEILKYIFIIKLYF